MSQVVNVIIYEMLVEASFFMPLAAPIARYVYAVLSLGVVNVMILMLYYSSAVYGEWHYTLWICTC